MISDGRNKPFMLEPEYPSMGNYPVFPHMVFAQFISYHTPEYGIYFGLEDERRGEKVIDFLCDEEGTLIRLRPYFGANFGESVESGFDTVIRECGNSMYDAAEEYRTWFSSHLPAGVRKVGENPDLPKWYTESPVIVTYPVRGTHDTDVMTPNRLFPYVNILPHLEKYRETLDSRFMVLLMHWEGTAPWAPPYVWPPYGGEDALRLLKEKLHENGDLIGLYTSGLGWTDRSNLIKEYDTGAIFRQKRYDRYMCLSPDGSLPKSRICTAQRSGYDICPCSDGGRKIMRDALSDMLGFGLDYVQVLDQNHGGAMYLCYAKDHGHPPTPGAWMTESVCRMLGEWKAAGKGTLLGCESSASEPFIKDLILSDCRYELNYMTGSAVPLFAFIYHEYLHNFMGNQVCSPFTECDTGLAYRLAYSFLAGDLLTLVIDQDGRIMPHWGKVENKDAINTELILGFTGRLNSLRKKYAEFRTDAKMLRPLEYECDLVSIGQTVIKKRAGDDTHTDKAVLSSSFRIGEGRLTFYVNYTDEPRKIRVHSDGEKILKIAGNHVPVSHSCDDILEITVPAYDAVDVISN